MRQNSCFVIELNNIKALNYSVTQLNFNYTYSYNPQFEQPPVSGSLQEPCPLLFLDSLKWTPSELIKSVCFANGSKIFMMFLPRIFDSGCKI